MTLEAKRLCVLVVLLTACRSRASSIAPDPAPTRTIAPAPSPPPPADAVRIVVRRVDGSSYSIEVSNVGSAPIDVGNALDVEKLGDGGWSSALYHDTVLELDCSKSKCTAIAAGATIKPGAWWGATAGCIQLPCSCMDGGICVIDCISTPAIAGTYRIVARSCDGTKRWESAPFAVAPPP